MPPPDAMELAPEESVFGRKNTPILRYEPLRGGQEGLRQDQEKNGHMADREHESSHRGRHELRTLETGSGRKLKGEPI